MENYHFLCSKFLPDVFSSYVETNFYFVELYLQIAVNTV